MVRRVTVPETTRGAGGGRPGDQLVLDGREDDEGAAAGLPVVRHDGCRGQVG